MFSFRKSRINENGGNHIATVFDVYVLCTKEGSNLNVPQIEAIYNPLTCEQLSIMQACLVGF